MERARSTLADSRRVIDDLRAPSTDTVDLQNGRSGRGGSFCCLYRNFLCMSLDHPASASNPIREHVLRFVSEGLTNIARHAEASEARVNLSIEMKELVGGSLG